MVGTENEKYLLFLLNQNFIKKIKLDHEFNENKKKFDKKKEKILSELEREKNKGNEKQFFETKLESAKKEKYRIEEKQNQKFGYIYDMKTLTKNLNFGEDTIRKLSDKEHFYRWKSGTRVLYKKEGLHSFISKNSYKYVNDIKIPCDYNRLPEYLDKNECAKILGINPRKFRSNVYEYLEKNHRLLEGVEILKIGSTVRIEKESFLRYVETLGGEKAK